jgi:heterodisulfide reductase subunit B
MSNPANDSLKYGYYPGCSLHSTGPEYDASFKAVCECLGIELEEINDWICCGASSAHSVSNLLATALPMKNLALAENTGISELAVPCAKCFSRLKKALYATGQNKTLHDAVLEVIDSPFKNNVTVVHPLEIFDKLNPEAVNETVTRNLAGLKVVCYYGCLLTRPPKVMAFDEHEYPMTMDRVLEKVGATVLDWSYKTDCCGTAFALMGETDVVLTLTQKILENAMAVGAHAIAVACPLCHVNLDTRQKAIEEKYQTDYGIPILYFTQLMGLAFGIEPQKLELSKHFVSPEPVLNMLSL